MGDRIADQFRHRCLEQASATPLRDAHLTDRLKLAVVLQIAALGAHLEFGGLRGSIDWRHATITRGGVLNGIRVVFEVDRSRNQDWLIELIEFLFQDEKSLPGRGQARKVARLLIRSWSFFPTPLQGDRAVTDILDLAPFLHEAAFADARRALAGEHGSEPNTTIWVAGRGRFRRTVLAQVKRLEQLERHLASDGFGAQWTSSSEGSRPSIPTDRRSRFDRLEKELEAVECNRAYSLLDLLKSRRSLTRQQASKLWSRVSSLRLMNGDLAGAERAAIHSLHLTRLATPSKAVVRLLLCLAEIRVRRGSVKQAETQLELAEKLAPDAAHLPAKVKVDLLQARLDLARGLPARSLDRLSRLDDEDQHDVEAIGTAQLLRARALGWLGRHEESRIVLAGVGKTPCTGLEPEELPALWALAGEFESAASQASGGAFESIWQAVLSGSDVNIQDWEPLCELEEFRAARLVLDVEMVRPGSVPYRWLTRARSTFLDIGAISFAERLDKQRHGAWGALESYLSRYDSERKNSVSSLFNRAGYFDTHLCWSNPTDTRVLVQGGGGPERLEATLSNGELLLEAREIDPTLRALFALTVRDYLPISAEIDDRHRVRGFVGSSDVLARALSRLDRFAGREITILIRGETGTGKEIAARQVHGLSCRSKGSFVPVNCAAISESLLLSELFGHVRGAFTGADRSRAGIFESAAGGTVFLDEIGDLPLSAQGKLLRVLQEGEVRRVGESSARRIDVRVVAATHRDLGSMIEKGDFRRDLYYRLNVGSVDLPPLRDRGQDVIQLAQHFLSQKGYSLTRKASQRLLIHSWPGNVRELKNIVDLAMALSEARVVRSEHLELPSSISDAKVGYHRQVEDFRRSLVRDALRASGGKRSEAARRLNLSRQALSYLAKTLRVD